MSKKEHGFFTVKELDKVSEGADYIFLAGARNNGKSYAVKSRVLQDAYNSIKDGVCKKQIAYIRRFTLDCTDSKCEPYFADMPIQEITNNEYTHIFIYRKEIYFGTFNNGKKQKLVKIGNCFALAAAEHYKSLMYPEIFNIIYEEVVSKNNNYLYHESDQLLDLISTILRSRLGRVYLIGNLISSLCPYYHEWNLNIDSLDFGESNVIKFNEEGKEPTIMVVYKTYPLDYNDKMFFGRIKKNIVQGEYITDIYPRLDKSVRHYNIIYKMILEYDTHKYTMYFIYNSDYKTHMWYIEKKTTNIKNTDRLITNHNKIGRKITSRFIPLADGERKLFAYLTDRTKICFSDNQTGTEFYNIVDKFK